MPQVIVAKGKWFHHDNTLAHKALYVKLFLTKTSMTELSTSQIHLIHAISFYHPQLKRFIRGKHFLDVEEVEKKQQALKESLTLQGFLEFQGCFEKWKLCLDQHIGSNGQYFQEVFA